MNSNNNRTPPRAGRQNGALSFFFSRRALQIYVFLFVNTLIFVMRSQWIISSPSSLDTSILSRHEAIETDLAKVGYENLGNRGHDSLRRERNVRSVEIAATDAMGHLLPKNQDVIDLIYARGKQRIMDELKRRHNNISSIEPFNPEGPVYIWDWFSPDYNCPTKERLGRVGDGGKWICGVDVLRSRKCLAYSFGVNHDLSFELELISRTECEVHAFDPTVGGLPDDCKDNPHITFHKQALGPVSGPSKTFMMMESLLDAMKRNGHTFIDVLKVDIEGSEWETFRAMLPEKALPFGQLLIELHFETVEQVFEFFENMDNHGFKIFMRETNHNPCASGKLPIAVEFSLINPSTYFRGLPEPEAVKAIMARPEPVKYNACIYILSHKGNMARLSNMLKHFDKHFNARYKYPIIIFHEDFDEEHKRQLKEYVHSPLQFRQISFTVPEWLDKDKIPERTICSPHSSTVGYRHMNRFLAYFAAEELSHEYDWQWRLDDDSLFTEDVGYDVFRFMAENKKRYGFTNILQDDPLCVLGLWNVTKEYIDRNRIQPTFFTRWYEGGTFYNNFEISHKSVWVSPEYKSFFNYIDRNGGIYYHRWGDAPIRTIGVSLFVNESEVHQFSDIAYTHRPFIARNASGLPSPEETLLGRVRGSIGNNCSSDVMQGGNNENSTCFSGTPSAVIYTVLTDAPTAFEDLMVTLKSIDKYFSNDFFYPVAVFGSDISYEKRTRIREEIKTMVEYHDIGFLEEEPLPRWIDRTRVPEYVDCAFGDDSILDRKRNRYMAFRGMQELAQQYDYMWRIAPGAVLTANVTFDPFITLSQYGKSFGYLVTMMDDPRCLKGLKEATNRYIRNNMTPYGLSPSFREMLPEHFAFYDGFTITHKSLWLSESYKKFYDYMDKEGGFFYSRWTETNVISTAMSLFTPMQQLYRFNYINFEHDPFVKHSTDRTAIQAPLESSWKDHTVNVEYDEELSKLFGIRQFGFLGSDVATSLRLPEVASGYGSYMWLFGDTFLGTSNSTKRDFIHHTINNALAFLPSGADFADIKASDVNFYWRHAADGRPAPVFKTVDKNTHSIYWPVSGVSVEYDGVAKIILFASRVEMKHNFTHYLVADGVNFNLRGTSVIIVDNPEMPPSRWKYRVTDMPGTNLKHNWFSAAALANGKEVSDNPNDTLYIVGNVGERGFGVFDEDSKNILGRIKISDLLLERFSELEVLTGEVNSTVTETAWVKGSPDDADRRPIFQPVTAETSLHYNTELQSWVSLAVDSVAAQLVLWTAPHPWGPWISTVIYNIPPPYDELSKYRCYAGKGHPELVHSASPGQGVELIFSYICNCPMDSDIIFEEGQSKLYVPQFIRVKLSPPLDERPAI